MAALTFDDAQDLVRYIVLHPELQAQLRPVILSAELLDLPAQTQRNAEAIERLSEETRAQGQRMGQLTERMDQLVVRMDDMAERMETVERAILGLTQQVAALTASVDKLVLRADAFEVWQGSASGDLLELKLERRLPGFLGLHMRRARVVTIDTMDPVEDALDSGRITTLEWDNLARTDAILVGKSKATGRELAVAVEVSVTVDLHDLERAAERARILRSCGYEAIGDVAGNRIRPEDEARARESRLAVLIDGHVRSWPDGA